MRFIIALLLLIAALMSYAGCSATAPFRKPTVGEEICTVACKRFGGEFHNMTEHPRKCYCVYNMPEFDLQKTEQKQSAPGTVYAY